MPQYEGLTTADLLEWCGDHAIVLDYIPDLNEIRKVPKQWLINIIYSLVGNQFKAWVREQIEARNSRMTVDREVMINLDPQIAAAFAKSTAISSKCRFNIISNLREVILRVLLCYSDEGSRKSFA